jgi:ribonuclease HII
MMDKKGGFTVGVDEVGRGPLAGRIFVSSVLLPRKLNLFLLRFRNGDKKLHVRFNLPRLNDSKKLSEKQRGRWLDWVKRNNVRYTVSAVSPAVIDRINIARACDRAARRAVLRLIEKNKIKRVKVFADAGISIKPVNGIASFKSFPKADEIIPAVSLASIIAKIRRDKEMCRLHKEYPRYGFDCHKGYGTKKHIRAIKKHGPSHVHRLSFLGNIIKSSHRKQRK